ncbi:MAG TPA: phosphate acyltransferase PlsX [Caldisericia bacterium]|nr:phosphate acyltransferase PlsX [Caldisericia bacterium]
MINISLDVSGGDLPFEERIFGALKALRENKDLLVTLVGDENLISPYLSKSEYNRSILDRIKIVDSKITIEMDEQPTKILTEKKNSSLGLATELVKKGECDGIVSAGNSGAQMAAALFQFGRISSIERPGIAIPVPTIYKSIVLIDGGANVEVKPKNLYDFAIMGSIFSKVACNIKEPKIALINNGTEEEKGNKLTKEAYVLLKNNLSNFIGYIEGREMMAGKADVVVCDGFTGNIILKTIEGVGLSILEFLKNDFKKTPFKMLGAYLLKDTFLTLKKKMDYKEYGGAPLLGVKGISIISHGSSDSFAIKNAILLAYKMANEDIINKISLSVKHELK